MSRAQTIFVYGLGLFHEQNFLAKAEAKCENDIETRSREYMRHINASKNTEDWLQQFHR